MSQQELIAWIVLGVVYAFCGIFTVFIVKGEKE